ncbi:MAG TPA: energy transducer TonB [Candidatus Angelobacter sp.]
MPASFAEDHLIQKVNPEYPQMARMAHIQGAVVLQCIIDKAGNVTQPHAVSGHPILIQAALDAVKKWKYRPFLLNGSPVAVKINITMTFHM